MTKENSLNHVFENKILRYKSYIDEFTPDLYKKFDSESKKIGLKSKINDLFSGKKINITEDLAAWHTKYRNEYSGLDDGLYVVNKKAFRKQGNQIAPVSLDSIIG